MAPVSPLGTLSPKEIDTANSLVDFSTCVTIHSPPVQQSQGDLLNISPTSICPSPTAPATTSPHYALAGLSPGSHPSPFDSTQQRILVGTSPSVSSKSDTTRGTSFSATPAFVSATEPPSSPSSSSPLDLSHPNTPSTHADRVSQPRHHTGTSPPDSSRSCSPLPILYNQTNAAGMFILLSLFFRTVLL